LDNQSKKALHRTRELVSLRGNVSSLTRDTMKFLQRNRETPPAGTACSVRARERGEPDTQ
jgi:hypothetical protein